jgi:hypothetical protein
MREKFPQYYSPTETEFEELWEHCVFVFDTSVILNLYQYSVRSRDEFLSILKKISKRIWIPNQVGQEYHSRRPHIIREQKENYHRIQEKIETTIKKLIDEIDNDKTIEYHPFIEKKEITKRISSAFSKIDSYLQECESKYPDLTKNDSIGEEIDKLFENKVGDEYTQEKLKELYDVGKIRYSQKIPPGYLDQQKGNTNQYGDYVLWTQILEYAKNQNKSVVFVTDDEKKDWWLTHESQMKLPEVILPHPQLVREFAQETNNRFFMYNSENFIKSYRKFLKEKVSNDTIKEIQNLRNQQSYHSQFEKFTSILNKSNKFPIQGINEEYQKIFGNCFNNSQLFEEYQKKLNNEPNRFEEFQDKLNEAYYKNSQFFEEYQKKLNNEPNRFEEYLKNFENCSINFFDLTSKKGRENKERIEKFYSTGSM